MSSLFLQKLIEKATNINNNINNNNSNNNSNDSPNININSNNEKIINNNSNNNNNDKDQIINETIESLNKEIEELENEIRLLSTTNIEEDDKEVCHINSDDNEYNDSMEEFENIKLLLNKFLYSSNKNYQQQQQQQQQQYGEMEVDGNNNEINEEDEEEFEKKFKSKKLIKQNQLMENLSGYKIDYGLSRVYLDEFNNNLTSYIFKGQCNNIVFNIEFIVSSDDNNNSNNTPFIKDLIIKVPLLYQLNFRNLLNHCKNTKSLGLLLNSFQKTTKNLLKRYQFFNSLFIILSKKLKQQQFNTNNNSNSNNNNDEFNCIYENKIITIPGSGYYSNSFIFHPDHFEPIFYLYWDIKYDIHQEQLINDIQVIANPLLYSKNQIDQIQLLLNKLSAYSKLSNLNLDSLSNLILIGLKKQKETQHHQQQ